MGKFDLLSEYLKTRTENEVYLTFSEIETIIKSQLSNSAYTHAAYWYDKTRPFATAWLSNNRVSVNFVRNKSVSFKKTDSPTLSQPVSIPSPSDPKTKHIPVKSLIHKILSHLSNIRPIFHSEADFQHQLAWEIQKIFPDSQIRLEYPHQLNKTIYLDITAKINDVQYAIELKYKTRGLSTSYDNEEYHLKDQSAQDLGRYDFLKDIERLEKVCYQNDKLGYAILLTNDSAYWKASNSHTIDAAFRLHEGNKLKDMLAWDEKAGKGTIRNRESPIFLGNEYECNWFDYSKVGIGTYTQFRYLCFEIK